MKIRRLKPADIMTVVAIDTAAGILLPWSPNSYARELFKETSYCWVAEVEGCLAGSLTLWDVVGEGEIANLAIHPDFWRQGIGRALLQTALDKAKELGFGRVLLEVRASNLAAQALYRSFGFEEDGRRRAYYANAEDAILMSKSESR
ncbi:MAG: ribosomal protein S18-alanine N-acetyltransferase [Anaerolineales bacterium]|jgi:ribosomal-protein-alanine N-acetyltransferase|nr:ribosomal protein S18-alanine N-acetyltransferase [Anaerolineales bacterium]